MSNLICTECSNPIDMKYEKNEKGFNKGYYWCETCSKKAFPKDKKEEPISELPRSQISEEDWIDYLYD